MKTKIFVVSAAMIVLVLLSGCAGHRQAKLNTNGTEGVIEHKD
jgi:outer membrane murein-binding lipoprotein Lpp